MAMTKRDYASLALSIRARWDQSNHALLRAAPGAAKAHAEGVLQGVQYLTWDIANLLQSENPRLDKSRFIHAALGYIPLHDRHPQDILAKSMEQAFAKALDNMESVAKNYATKAKEKQ